MSEFLYKSETYAIIGAMMEVHKVLGSGFFEIVYQESLSIEFTKRNIPFSEQPKIDIFYKGEKLSKFYVPDFICFDKIVVEIKALSELNTEHEAQLLNGLKATGSKIGILSNFGETSLRYKRFIY